jgi:multimeric flavodoxin WrbA
MVTGKKSSPQEILMKICVLNGSPKGRDSVTMQYVRFLELAFPSHTFVIENVGQRIAAIEVHDEEFSRVIASVSSADAVLFATPVYYMLVPAQLKRFIELVFIRNASSAFSEKYAASLTTSIHFFDHTANAYLHAIAEDLGMNWAGSFMAKTDDLLLEKNQEALVLFAGDFFDTAIRKPALQRTYPPLTSDMPQYRPGPVPLPFDAGEKNVVILSDAAPGSNLEKMVTRAASCFGRAASIVSLDEADMKGGCLGCCRCAFDNSCVYTDGFRPFFEETVLSADILILAGSIRDRYLSAKFKQFFDRSFYRGHVPCMTGKQVGFLIEGPFSQCCTLREVLSVYPALQGANLAGIVTDEGPVSANTDARIDAFCDHSLRLLQSGYVAPAGFQVVGGHKIFRDEIWGSMRAVFRADHTYYREHGMYDFPQGDLARRIRTSLLSLFLSIPLVRKKAELQMRQHMIQPFARVFTKSPLLKQRAGKD